MKKTIHTLIVTLFSASAIAQNNIADFTSVNPVITSFDPNLYIPSTHDFQVLIEGGDALTLGGTKGINSDFSGYRAINGSSKHGYLCINSESLPGGVCVMEIKRNTSNKWETIESGNVDFGGLSTLANCSGTITPWGTMITCEENDISVDGNADGYEDYGWAIEIDPVTRKAIDQDGDTKADKLWALGKNKYENVCIASDRKTVYFGRETSDGHLYKFVANVAEKLNAGTLYVMQVTGSSGTWLSIPNTSKAERNGINAAATTAGASTFGRIEDVEIGPDGKIYYTATSEGRVYKLQDNGSSISDFGVFVENANYTINDGTVNHSVSFNSPDNLCFDNQGNLWITQDGGDNHVWVVKPNHTASVPQISVFCNVPDGSESTGITFSPDGKYLFLSIQHPGNNNKSTMKDRFGKPVSFSKDATLSIALKQTWADTASANSIVAVENERALNCTYQPNENALLFVFSNNNVSDYAQVSIVDMVGNVVLNETVYQPQQQIAIGSLPKAIYLVKMKVGNQFFTEKMVLGK
jgi:secreted PhoX family phosphatase